MKILISFALLALTAGQDRPEVVPHDPDAARQLVRDALTLYGVGIIRQRQDRLVEAVRCLEDAVRLDPEAISPRQLLIPLYTALGRPSDAAATAAAVVAIDPSRADTWRTLARLLHEMKRTGDAINVLNRCVATPALADYPADRIAAYHDLAKLHTAPGTHAQSAAACRKALDLLTRNQTDLLKNAEPADLDGQRGDLFELLASASLATNQFVDARDAALEARDAFRKANEPNRAIDVAPNLAAAYAGLKEIAKAHALLDDHITARPRDVTAFALKARLLREAGDGVAAITLLNRAANSAPEFVPLRVLLGDECRREGDMRQAEQAYRAAIYQKADLAAYRGLFALMAGPGGNAAALLNTIDDKVHDAVPERPNNVKEDEAGRRRRGAAADHIRTMATALRLEPAAAALALTRAVNEVRQRADRSFETWSFLADVAERAGLLATAEDLFRAALTGARRDPDHRFLVVTGLLHVLLAERKRGDAVAVCEEAIEFKPMAQYRPIFEGQLAWILAHLDRIDEALGRVENAVKEAHGPQMLSERIRRAEILAYAERFDAAEAECRKLLQDAKVPGDIQRVRHTLAFVYSTARQFDKAEEQFRLVLELDPADAEAHNSLGYELADRGRNLDEAERLIRRALELDRARKSDSLEDEGENASYVDSLGWVLFRRGRFAEAKALVEQAAETPSAAANPEIWDHLGDICARMDKPAEAAAAWDKALALSRTEKRTINDPRGTGIERKLKRLR